ncbi:hypothetical protein ABIB40_003019 [Pedobacter sp. UYP30]
MGLAKIERNEEQVSTPSAPQIKNAEPNTLAQINPLANSKKL